MRAGTLKLPQLTWGIFGAHHDQDGRVLIKQRSNGTWDLPGGGMDDGETSHVQTLAREMDEEVGLKVLEVRRMIGSPLPFHIEAKGVTDVAVLYETVAIGTVRLSDEAIDIRYIDIDEAMDWLVSRREGETILGPEGRVGRMPRMILDALTMRQEPDRILEAESDAIRSHDIIVSHDGSCLYHTDKKEVRVWRRRDPFSVNGYVQPS